MLDHCGGGDLPERCDGEAVETSRTEADDSGARVAPAPRPHKKKAMLQNETRGSEQREEDEEKDERKRCHGGARSRIRGEDGQN